VTTPVTLQALADESCAVAGCQNARAHQPATAAARPHAVTIVTVVLRVTMLEEYDGRCAGL
jgi:hypothetical protein